MLRNYPELNMYGGSHTHTHTQAQAPMAIFPRVYSARLLRTRVGSASVQEKDERGKEIVFSYALNNSAAISVI